jgi:hypothetical protein
MIALLCCLIVGVGKLTVCTIIHSVCFDDVKLVVLVQCRYVWVCCVQKLEGITDLLIDSRNLNAYLHKMFTRVLHSSGSCYPYVTTPVLS